MKKKVLVLGATGAMGVYLVPELLSMGYAVDAVSLDRAESCHPDLRCIQAKDAKDPVWIGELLKNEYDGIVDFMVYNTAEFRQKYEQLVSHTGHYIYLSSYRIYGNEEHPIRETSPRLLECSKDEAFLATEDYALYKARGEDMLKASGYTNWTAIRPAITYSKCRFQLVTLEANVLIPRMRAGKTVLLPKDAMEVEATMSWAGDVARMIARLLFNPAAKCEIYSVCTSEHHPWKTVAEYYQKIAGLRYDTVSTDEYIALLDPAMLPIYRYQLIYDRYFDRIMDNTKILNVTGMKQSELTTLYDGLKREYDALPADCGIHPWTAVCDRMDAFLEKRL